MCVLAFEIHLMLWPLRKPAGETERSCECSHDERKRKCECSHDSENDDANVLMMSEIDDANVPMNKNPILSKMSFLMIEPSI
ncbi:hypothetical protein AVEN_161812-1 [Araneus ventricosus]|uniref:Uncharacterized protein n=1 Tax=Araneus ventricosus TaxID=182803 RepID=A0A4Y2EUN6_ARAVE|nr:hypothetical protein AVEN_161812-1 [Araneus ventricosus]